MENLFGIPELLVIIYKNLTFTDQLRFAQANSFLKNIFESFIFPVKYTKLKITTLREMEKLLISNDMDENCLLLTHDEVKNFLQFGADKVEEVHVRSELHEDTYIGDLLQFFCAEAWGNLQSLTCLHYTELALSEKHLLLIAENYTTLSELRLFDCINEDNGENLMVGRGLSITTLARMNQLKSLTVDNESVTPIGMSLFCELITNVPLECLKLTASLVLDMQDNLLWKSFYHQLKELEIDFDGESLKFFERTGILKNLIRLNVNKLHNVMDSVFATITKACENLECLTIGYGTDFKNITHFQIPPNLKELTVGEDLKHTHVIDILTKSKIEKFTCRFVGDQGLFKDFKMSPYIKVLDLEGINTTQCLSSYSNNTTLKELHWYEGGQNFPGAAQNLKTCKNLENLTVQYGFIPLDVILELNHLQILKIRWSYEQLNWSYIIGILKHSSLKELEYFMTYGCSNYAENIPVKGFPSSVTFLYIGFELLDKALGFWLDMLQQNPIMLIKSDALCNFDFSFLKKLIQHKNIPDDLTEVKVWGFNLKSKDLRENFHATIAPLEQIKIWNWTKCTLVLSRKQTLIENQTMYTA